MVLIDTSVWIRALRKNYNEEIKKKVDQLLQNDIVIMMGIIKLELLGGTKTENEFSNLKGYLDSLYFFHTNTDFWNEASELAFTLRKNGVTIPYTDIIIATGSLLQNATLIHADKHFDLIAEKTDLKCISYVSEIK